MTEKTIRKFEPGDKVWIMEYNTPHEKLIFAVVESLATSPWDDPNDIHYRLVDGRLGTGWGNNEGTHHGGDGVYATRKELIESL